MDVINMLGITSVGLIIFLIAVKFVGELIIVYWLNRKLESKKIELQNQLDIIKIQFANLHSKRMEFVEQIHTNLFSLHDLINSYLQTTHHVLNNSEYEEHQREKQAFELLTRIQTDFKKQKLYLSKTLSDKIEELIESFSKSCYQGNLFKKSLNSKNISDEDCKALKQRLEKISETNINSIPPILAEIESDFREIFGIK